MLRFLTPLSGVLLMSHISAAAALFSFFFFHQRRRQEAKYSADRVTPDCFVPLCLGVTAARV